MAKGKRKQFFSVQDAREFYLCIDDLLQSEAVQSMKKFTQHGTTSTFDHCIVVAFRSFLFCKKFHLDYKAAARGGLLHDLFLYDWHDKQTRSKLHGFYHPGIALKNAENSFSLTDKEREIIKKHMWPLTVIPPTCREAYIISYYDKVCTSREVVVEWGGALLKAFNLLKTTKSETRDKI
ncbi:MAG: HD family phosphohydrolase [Ruminococcus sp.]|nr:HD family phosphohydrolase [Ruminococcus sp.]